MHGQINISLRLKTVITKNYMLEKKVKYEVGKEYVYHWTAINIFGRHH